MQLVFKNTGKTVRAGDPVTLVNKGDSAFAICEVKKPNSKKPQGQVPVVDADKKTVFVTPQDIGAEWIA